MEHIMIAARNVHRIYENVPGVTHRKQMEISGNCHAELIQKYARIARGHLASIVAWHIQMVWTFGLEKTWAHSTSVPNCANIQSVIFKDAGANAQKSMTPDTPFSKCPCGTVHCIKNQER